ncbi:MAG TPA: glycosyltransferase family 4 protein [Actinomycetota bacterium]
MRVLLVTNDFPPRAGGIQTYLWEIYRRLPAQGIEVRVLAPRFDGAEPFDAASGLEVVRGSSTWWSSRALTARIRDHARDADAVALGAVLPMNLAARALDRPVVVHTYGFEVAWARLPGPRQILRRIAGFASLVTGISDYAIGAVQRALGDRALVRKVPTGVDLERFTPDAGGAAFRDRHGVDPRAPVAVFLSRLVRRKGADALIDAWRIVRRAVPGATLLVAGDGPDRERLRRTAGEGVIFTGRAGHDELPSVYAAGDVFAMPCRSRLANLEVEGLGIVYLEAQACGRPAIAGDSGGAPEAVVDGETGLVVPGRNRAALARALTSLLADPPRARAMGKAGRAFVEAHHDWNVIARDYAAMLRAM